MLQKPVIKLRDLRELQCTQNLNADNYDFITPFKVKKNKRSRTADTKPKKLSPSVEIEQGEGDPVVVVVVVPPTPKPATNRSAKSARKDPPPSQLRINSFFRTCEKSYKIKPLTELPTSHISKKANGKRITRSAKNSSSPHKRKSKMGRKRLFLDESSESDDDSASNDKNSVDPDWEPVESVPKTTTDEYITVILDSDEEEMINKKPIKPEDVKNSAVQHKSHLTEKATTNATAANPSKSVSRKQIDVQCSKTSSTKGSTPHSNLRKSCLTRVSNLVDSLTSTDGHYDVQNVSMPYMDDGHSVPNLTTPNGSPAVANSKTPVTAKRKPKPCPPYKIVEGTTFAVDAFQYGCISAVTHYFLTHFHADHYIGLTRKFAMPVYMSTITARLVRTFIPIDEQYIHELEINTPLVVDNVEITALEANHCPGAIMLLFKFLNTGKCILHTGDFRAWHGMESEPAFWNNDIHTIYLDTTYICHKYAFCTQHESIDKAKDLIDKFREKNSHNRILYVCGSYMIGKEKFWSAIAEEYELNVWTEANRSKALKSIDDSDLNKFLVDDPKNAGMHVIAMGKMSYLNLIEYFRSYEHEYDTLLAIRPSGWEKDSKPQYRGKINIIGVEYSEHSSYEEMQRFVMFLKPQKVISTVPTGRDLMKTAVVPEKWYKYEKLQSSCNYQPCIEQFMCKTPQKKLSIRLPNERMGGLESFVSPLKKKKPRANDNNNDDTIVSTTSCERDLSQSLPGHTNPFGIQANSSDYQELSNNVNKNNDKIVVKQEFNEDTGTLKKPDKTLKSTSQRATTQNENEPKTPEKITELTISQRLNDAESCTIFIPTPSEFEPVSRGNSSDFFESSSFIKNNGRCKDIIRAVPKTNSSLCVEPSTSKSKKRRANDCLTSGEEIPVSQKRTTRLASKQKKVPSVASTMDEDDLEFEIQLLKSNQEQASTQKQQEKTDVALKVTQTNPLLASTTNSYASSTNQDVAASETCMDLINIPAVVGNTTLPHNEQIPASQTTNDLANTPRPLRNKIKDSLRQINVSQNDEVSASQTTNDLANTPRPLRNKIKSALSQIYLSQNEEISASQTTNDLANNPRPWRNKMKLAYLWETTDQEDEIPASQTSKDLENTPRPLRNKRKNSNICSASVATTRSTRSKEKPLYKTGKHGRFTAPASSCMQTRSSLAQILEENEAVDIYDISQSAKIIAEVLANQDPDKSVDHIPPELLSSEDLGVGSEEFEDVKPFQQQMAKEPSKQQSDESIDYKPTLEFLSEDEEPTIPLKQIDVYKPSQLVGLVVDALSQQQPDTSIDHIPPELLSPTDQDADDDWLY